MEDTFKEDEQTNQASWSWLWNGDECKGIVRNHESDTSEKGTWFYSDPSQWTDCGRAEYIVDRYGPFDTEEEAKADCERYIKYMNTPPPEIEYKYSSKNEQKKIKKRLAKLVKQYY